MFEPHTAIIRKGKPGHDVEFGRAVWLDEVEGGIVTALPSWMAIRPMPTNFNPVLITIGPVFDRPPSLLIGDRKVFSPKGEAYAIKQGVKYVRLTQARRQVRRSPRARTSTLVPLRSQLALGS